MRKVKFFVCGAIPACLITLGLDQGSLFIMFIAGMLTVVCLDWLLANWRG